MSDTAVKGIRSIYDGVTPTNTLRFIMRNMINSISTATPCKVVGVESGGSGSTVGYVDVLPLTTGVDGSGEAVQPTTLYHLPYFRLQGGKVAIVTDPVAGDIGLAVFSQRDSSNVTAGTDEPQQPASYRTFSQSDGFYVGGFLNQPPSCFLELTQDDKAILTAKGGIEINGDVKINGTVKTSSTIDADGTITGNGHSLSTHTHTGVHGETSTPNG